MRKGSEVITEPRRSLADLLESLTATEGKASRPGNGGSETLSPDEDPALLSAPDSVEPHEVRGYQSGRTCVLRRTRRVG